MSKSFRTGKLLRDILPVQLQNNKWSDLRVTGLAVDSRKIKAGDCFLAYPGHAVDGRAFIANALQQGATAVLAEAHDLHVDSSAQPVVAVPGLKQHLGDIASAFFGDPSRQLQLVAVTGTNGKTTVTQLIVQALQLSGVTSGVMGTLGNGIPGRLEDTANTTPDVVETNRLLRDMLDQGARAVAMEASSHGLVQGRLDGLTLHTAIITNLSRDHLDYHGSMEAYRDAKALLARNSTLQHLALNADDPVVAGMAADAAPGVKLMTFSLNAESDVSIKAGSIEFHQYGIRLRVRMGAEEAVIDSPLVGEFNASNLLAAAAGLVALGVSLADACGALSRVEPVAGRVQRVNPGQRSDAPAVVVDFAHTPDALEKVLTALRRHCSGRLWCVFGCGGDRDTGKRPLMGAMVARHADEMVVTSDNPRTEKPARILADIVKGIPAGRSFQVIENRNQAVEYAVLNAAAEDLILLAGKGHEDYQDVQGVKHPYSDVSAAQQALDKRNQIGNQGQE